MHRCCGSACRIGVAAATALTGASISCGSSALSSEWVTVYRAVDRAGLWAGREERRGEEREVGR